MCTLTHSVQMQGGTVTTRKNSICEQPAALLCIALTLIEWTPQQCNDGSGTDWP
jgi:hypothetical protein